MSVEPLFVRYRGLQALCVAYVVHEGQVVLLSVAGAAVMNNGLWAALLAHETLAIAEQPTLYVRRVPAAEHEAGVKTLARRRAASDYKTLRKRLPETGKQQLAMVHRQATAECAMDRDFFVLGEPKSADAPLERFFHQFTCAVACAARPAWSAFLWQRGHEAQLIVPCTAVGLSAWCVSANADAWACIVREGILAKTIG
jgi:hypothetical protein